jgi:hypothetical protein
VSSGIRQGCPQVRHRCCHRRPPCSTWHTWAAGGMLGSAVAGEQAGRMRPQPVASDNPERYCIWRFSAVVLPGGPVGAEEGPADAVNIAPAG